MNNLDFAIKLARDSGEIARKYFGKVATEWKLDDTPITQADREINDLVLDRISKAYPTYSIIAEEGSREQKSDFTWVCDPIDGTVPFSRGIAFFSFSLALVNNEGKPILGVIYDPILDRMFSAKVGKGAFMNGEEIHVNSEKVLSKFSFIQLASDERMAKLREILLAKYYPFVSILYSTALSAALVAGGRFSANVYDYTMPWDAAASKIIVEEAGGKATDVYGNDQRYDQKIKGFVATNGLIHDELLGLVKQVVG